MPRFDMRDEPLPSPSIGVVGFGSKGNGDLPQAVPSFVPGIAVASNSLGTDDNNANFNQGIGAGNWHAVNQTVIQHFTDRFPEDSTHVEMLSFIVMSERSKWLGLRGFHEIASLAALNKYMVSPEGRRRYGSETSPEKILEHFAFAGKYNIEPPEYSKNQRPDFEANVVVSRIARVASVYTRACRAKNMTCFDPQLWSVWLTLVRRKLLPSDLRGIKVPASLMSRGGRGTDDSVEDDGERFDSSGKDVSTGLSKDIPDQHYWDWGVLVRESNRSRPPGYLYCSDEDTGDCYKIGYITEFAPSHKLNAEVTRKSRAAISGVRNFLHTGKDGEEDFIELTSKAPYVNIALRC